MGIVFRRENTLFAVLINIATNQISNEMNKRI